MSRRADPGLAVALAAYGQAEVWLPDLMPGVEPAAHRGVLAVAALIGTLPVAVRTRHPLAALLVCAAGIALPSRAGFSQDALAPFAAMLLIAFSVGAHAPLRAGLATLAGALAVLTIGDPADSVFAGLVVGAPFVGGVATRRGREQAERLERLTQQLAAEQERSAELAVELERHRVARELHDVVAHGLGLMVLQAGAVRRLLRTDQADERVALEAAEHAGRDALGELRRVVGGLRAPDGSPALPSGLEGLETLAERLRLAGLPVAIRVTGQRRPLPAALDHSAYRIVQEALTNALKHAGPARAEVVVGFEPQWLDVAVTDDGRGPNGNGEPPGFGLVGMRERAGIFGGRLDAGPGEAGGFVVHARFPLEPER